MSEVSQSIDRYGVVFDDESLVADAGLLAAGTLVDRLGLEDLVDRVVRLRGRVGGANSGRKVLTVVSAMLAGATHIDHVDLLRAGSTGRVLPFRVMAPSTVGTFLRAFTWGHVRQLEKVLTISLGRVWRLGAGPPKKGMTLDLDSTICEVSGKSKQGAAYGYTNKLGYHPLFCVPGRYGRGGRCPPPGRGIAARCGPFRPRDHTPHSAGRGRGPDQCAGRFGVLVLRHAGSFGSVGGGLVDHRAAYGQGQSHDRRDRRRGLDGYRLPAGRRSTGRGNRVGDDQLEEAVGAAAGSSRGAPHPPHRSPSRVLG